MTTRRDDLIGVLDGQRQPWCLGCWGAREELTTTPIRLRDRDSRRPCQGCARVLSTTSPAQEVNTLPIHLDGRGCWPDLPMLAQQGRLIHLPGRGLELARMPRGLSSGRSSVSIRVNLPGGQVVVVETTMRLFLAAADAFRAAEPAS